MKISLNLQYALSAYQLGTLVSSSQITGGSLHHTFRVTTDQGDFAIKHLNQDLEQFQHLEITETIARTAKDQSFPTRTALLYDKKAVFWQGTDAYIVYPYLQGQTLSADDLHLDHLNRIAQALAKLHQLKLTLPTAPAFKPFVINPQEWSRYLSGFEFLLESRLPQFLDITTRHLDAFERLKQHTVISHRDFTPDNLLWYSDRKSFTVIDWELAGFINPELEMLNNAIDAADTINGIKTDNVFCYLKAYKTAMSRLNEDPLDLVYGCLGSWVYWILFCLKRQNHTFKPLDTEKMIRKSLLVIDFLLGNAKNIAKTIELAPVN